MDAIRHWIDTQAHRAKGHIAVTVTAPGQKPRSYWALAVFPFEGELLVDLPEGETLKFPLNADFVVTA